jgi:hypothetical protein
MSTVPFRLPIHIYFPFARPFAVDVAHSSDFYKIRYRMPCGHDLAYTLLIYLSLSNLMFIVDFKNMQDRSCQGRLHRHIVQSYFDFFLSGFLLACACHLFHLSRSVKPHK